MNPFDNFPTKTEEKGYTIYQAVVDEWGDFVGFETAPTLFQIKEEIKETTLKLYGKPIYVANDQKHRTKAARIASLETRRRNNEK